MYNRIQNGLLLVLLLVCVIAEGQTDENKDDGKVRNKTFDFIQLGYSAGFKTYGILALPLKQQNLTSVVSGQMQIIGAHSLYAEFINQPMMKLTEPNFELDARPFFAYHYDVYIRSQGFNVGYAYTNDLGKNFDCTIMIAGGITYLYYREYLTDKKNLSVQSFDGENTLWNASVGVRLHYFLPNHLGLHGEASLAYNSPLFKLGLTYKIKTK